MFSSGTHEKRQKLQKKSFTLRIPWKVTRKGNKEYWKKAYNLFLHLLPRCFSCFAISPSAVWTMFSKQVGFHFFPFSFEILVTFMELSDPITYVTMQECGADLLIFSLFSIIFLYFFSLTQVVVSLLSPFVLLGESPFVSDRWLDNY